MNGNRIVALLFLATALLIVFVSAVVEVRSTPTLASQEAWQWSSQTSCPSAAFGW